MATMVLRSSAKEQPEDCSQSRPKYAKCQPDLALCYNHRSKASGRRSVDEVDRQLISLLRNDARMPVAALAKALRVSRGTVQNRMARLEADGTIASYTIRLKPAVEEHRIRALMTVAVEGNQVDGVIKALRGDPAVTTLHSTNGRWDIVVELRAESLEAFDRVLGRIRLIEGISQSETSLLLSTFK
jgi:DNA-binding Lrp family transcriptional regulator